MRGKLIDMSQPCINTSLFLALRQTILSSATMFLWLLLFCKKKRRLRLQAVEHFLGFCKQFLPVWTVLRCYFLLTLTCATISPERMNLAPLCLLYCHPSQFARRMGFRLTQTALPQADLSTKLVLFQLVWTTSFERIRLISFVSGMSFACPSIFSPWEVLSLEQKPTTMSDW